MLKIYNQYHGNDLEDAFLVKNFDLPDYGVFVDIGAGPDGIQGSNSYHFEKNGWKVLCADADPRNKECLSANRKNAFSVVISNIPKEVIFNLGNDSPDVSGIVKTDSNGADVITLPTMTLYDLLLENKIKKIDILSLDTEGTEIDVWESMRPDIYRPSFVVIEAITQGEINPLLPGAIEKYGYRMVSPVGANLILKDDTVN